MQVLALVALVFTVYANTLWNSFHYDDSHSLLENPHIRTLANIPRFFKDPTLFSREPAMAMYRPVVLVTYAFNYALGQYRPLGYHMLNILLHAAGVVLVYLFLVKWQENPFYAWWGSALWGLHPIHTQVVNYISARAEMLAALGVLAALLLLLKKKWAAALPVYALGLLAKSTAVALVPLWLWQVLWNPKHRRRWVYFLLCGGMTSGYLALIWANGFLSGSINQEVRSSTTQLFTQIKALVYYLKLLSMPVGLSIEHAFYESQTWHEAAVFFSGLLLLSLTYLAWRGWHIRQVAAWGWGWFLAGVGLTFVWPLNLLVNEHRLYLASLGLAWIFFRRLPRYSVACATALLMVWSILAIQRNTVWESEYTLWQDAVRKAPKMFRAQSNWGLALYTNGELDAAETSLNAALKLNPGYAKTWNNLGLIQEELGRPQAAKTAYDTAVRLRPDLVGAYTNLGRLELALGDLVMAQAHLKKAVELDPSYSEGRLNLGLYYQRTGQYERAAGHYRQVLVLEPENGAAYNNMGLLYQDMGAIKKARKALEKAVALVPEDITARVNLALLSDRINGVAALDSYKRLAERYPDRTELWQGLGELYAHRQAWPEAIAAYAQANLADPSNILLYPHWGDAYLGAGMGAEAAQCYKKAIAGLGDTAGLYNSLAAAYAGAGDLQQALAACRKVLALEPGNEQAARNLEKLLAALQESQ